jgi:hypothetical protein
MPWHEALHIRWLFCLTKKARQVSRSHRVVSGSEVFQIGIDDVDYGMSQNV